MSRLFFHVPNEALIQRRRTVCRLPGDECRLRPGAVVDSFFQDRPLGQVRILNCRPERLNQISERDLELEGFAGFSRALYVRLFCSYAGGESDQRVIRVEFEWEPQEVGEFAARMPLESRVAEGCC